MKDFFKKYWHWTAVTLLFLLMVFVFADVPAIELIRTKVSVVRLRAEEENYLRQIAADSLFLEQMKENGFLEKYAREKFYMHAADEQLFLFE